MLGLGVVDGVRYPSDWQFWKYSWVVICGPYLGGAAAALFFEHLYRPFVVRWR
jgi:glycerol uptake facilitator-like aquaporin